MKIRERVRQLCMFALLLSLFLFQSIPAYTTGGRNLGSGGGGMGQGTSQSDWSPGNEGVWVTVIRAADRAMVTRSVDLTNKKPKIVYPFGKVSKAAYTQGTALSVNTGVYGYVSPAQSLPRIISPKSLGAVNIGTIKSYFTDEQVVRSIAGLTGMDFDTLINGDYWLLIEPISFLKFQGNLIAYTVTKAALYDEQTSGNVRTALPAVGFQNLPLSMFLETPDLGYPAWEGPRSGVRSNREIKSSLGLGMVRFNEVPPEPPEVSICDYEYRANTEVITAADVSGGQSDPDDPVSVTFHVGGRSYTVNNVYYPEGDSQFAWICWTTPDTPQTMTITVNVHGGGSVTDGTILVDIVDLDENPPPDPNVDDRSGGFTKLAMSDNPRVTPANQGVWRPWWQPDWIWYSGDEDDDECWYDHEWREFDFDRYSASLSVGMRIIPDEKSPIASGRTMKSGYGFNETVTTHVSTNQGSAVTTTQNVVTYFPEFQYGEYQRLLERVSGDYDMIHEFKEDRYSTYNRRTHFTPIWYPDGSYMPYAWLIDCWTRTTRSQLRRLRTSLHFLL